MWYRCSKVQHAVILTFSQVALWLQLFVVMPLGHAGHVAANSPATFSFDDPLSIHATQKVNLLAGQRLCLLEKENIVWTIPFEDMSLIIKSIEVNAFNNCTCVHCVTFLHTQSQQLGGDYSLYTWPCALLLAQHIYDQKEFIGGKKVLEVRVQNYPNYRLLIFSPARCRDGYTWTHSRQVRRSCDLHRPRGEHMFPKRHQEIM